MKATRELIIIICLTIIVSLIPAMVGGELKVFFKEELGDYYASIIGSTFLFGIIILTFLRGRVKKNFKKTAETLQPIEQNEQKSISSRQDSLTTTPKNKIINSNNANTKIMKQITILHHPKDEAYLNNLIASLKPFQRRELISIWSEKNMQVGENVQEKFKEAITESFFVVVLLSPSFLSSKDDYLLNHTTLAKVKGKLYVPVLIRSCSYQREPLFQDLHILPNNGIPVSKWEHKDDAWFEISEEMIKILEIDNAFSIDKTIQTPRNNMNNQTSKEEILQLIESELDAALDKLDTHFGQANGTYNDLANEYFQQPNNFSLANYRSRLKRFVKRNV